MNTTEVTWVCPVCKSHAQEADDYLVHTCRTNFLHIRIDTLQEVRLESKK